MSYRRSFLLAFCSWIDYCCLCGGGYFVGTIKLSIAGLCRLEKKRASGDGRATGEEKGSISPIREDLVSIEDSQP